MIYLTISGGAFYIKGMAAAVYTSIFEFGNMPSVLIGSSSGALIAAFTAILGVERMFEIAKKVNLQEAHAFRVFKQSGAFSLRALWRLARNKPPVIQDVSKIVLKYITGKEFADYQLDKHSPGCFILAVNVSNMERKYFDLKKCSYLEMLSILEASCAMQGMTAPVEVNGEFFWDGGQLDHQPAAGGILEKLSRPAELQSVYSRPSAKNWNLEEFDSEEAGFFALLNRMIEADNREKSLNDETALDYYCKDKGIKNTKICVPRVLKNFYDNNPERQRKQLQAGRSAARWVLTP